MRRFIGISRSSHPSAFSTSHPPFAIRYSLFALHMLHKLRLAINGKIPPWAKEGYLKCREFNASSRALPDFLIIGAQKAGTTSLFNYLCLHPQITGSMPKEVMFFTAQFSRGVDWYQRHFPLRSTLARNKALCGEATPTYLYSLQAPEHVASITPAAKLIIVMREPAARAVSHYYHEKRCGLEKRPINEVFSESEIERWRNGDCPDLPAKFYFKWGDYASALEQWLSVFSRDQLLLIDSADFFKNSEKNFESVCDFLEIQKCGLLTEKAFNAGSHKEKPIAFGSMKAAFSSQNQRLRKLGFSANWC